MTKMGQKLIKLHKNCVVFWYIVRIYSLKIFAGGGLGGATAHSSPMSAPLERHHCLYSTCAASDGEWWTF